MDSSPSPGLEALEYWLPEKELTNEDLAQEFDGLDPAKIFRSTGIRSRRVSSLPASDMAVRAAEKLFSRKGVDRGSVDFLFVVTQTCDHQMPATACIVQDKLKLSPSCGAADITLGCSGYVYALFLSKALLNSGQCRNVLLLTVEKVAHLHPKDRSTRVLLGEAATATLLSCSNPFAELKEFDLGTDGSGYKNLVVPAGGTALPRSAETARDIVDEAGNVRSLDTLHMDGMEIFNFSMQRAPATLEAVLQKNGLQKDEIDLFVPHQANKMILETLRVKMGIEKERYCLDLETTGNTSSCTIPIALRNRSAGLKPGDTIVLCGFGIGYSWGSAVLKWRRSYD